MLKNYLKTAWRNLWKNKLLTAVNIIGLTIGLSSIVALLAGVYMYYTTDHILQGKQHMYYTKSYPKGDRSKAYMQSTYPLLDEIVRNNPEVVAATHIQEWYQPWIKNNEKELQEKTLFVDTGFFKVFTLPLKYGQPEQALNSIYNVVLSDNAARILFGNENPMGKTVMANDTIPLTVTGVLEPIPSNTNIKGEVFLTTGFLKASNVGFEGAANWYNGFALNYLRLRNDADIPKLESSINKIVELNYDKNRAAEEIMLVPFSNLKNENGLLVKTIVSGSIATSVFILLVILINLVNLNIASVYTRSKEVAVRRIIGGRKRNIILQFCIENMLVLAVSLILAVLLFFSLLLPALNNIYSSQFTELHFNLQDYPFAIALAVSVIVLAIMAGSLPALKIIAQPAATAAKGIISSKGNNSLWRNAFIILQFSLAVIFICVTLILNQQINHMKTASLGFDKEHTIVANLDLGFKNFSKDSVQFARILYQLKNNPAVAAITTTSVIPTNYDENYNTYYDPATNKEVGMRHAAMGAGFPETFGIPVVQGRDFNDELAASETNSLMINRKAMQELGWQDITGKQLKQKGSNEIYKVVGVMEDYNYQSLEKGIQPIVHWYSGRQSLYSGYLSVRITGNNFKNVAEYLETELTKMSGRKPVKIEYMSTLVGNQYELLNGILKISNFVAFLTIVISCMGMFALVSIYAKQRVKEIGVRKVLGAGVMNLVLLLSKEFILFVLAACAVAIPIAFWVMHCWLQEFVYRIDIQWWMFAIASFIALIIASATVSMQAVKAALANPVKSLRTE